MATVVALTGLLATTFVNAAVLTVGAPGTGCTHTNVQTAVNNANAAPGSDTIRIARDASWTAQQITIDTNDELHVIGGYATCASTEPAGAATILSGAGGNARPVLTVRGNGFVFLRNLTIREGDQADDDPGGGVNFVGGGILDIADTSIIENTAGYGGGIYAEGTSLTAEVVLGDNVTVGFNTARFNGGGIWTSGLEFSIRGRNSSIMFNEALGELVDTGYGGGVYLTSTDSFDGYVWLSAGGIGGVGAVYANTAKHGGGIAIVGGIKSGHDADARIFTRYPDAPVRINDNTASIRGGGFYLKNDADATDGYAFAIARMWHAFVTDNAAPDGAAVFSDLDTAFFSFTTLTTAFLFNQLADTGAITLPLPAGAVPCPANGPCGAISGNIANTATGATIKLTGDEYLVIHRALMQNNQGARLIDVVGSEYADVKLFNSLITSNTVAQELVRQPDDRGTVDIRQTTITDNTIGTPHVIAANDTLYLVNSLFWQPGKMTIAPGANYLRAEYILTNDASNMGSNAGLIAAPRFVDPANGDYMLRAGARGVDFAPFDSEFPSSSGISLNGSMHNFDVPHAGVPVPDRLADVGAYERPALLPLVLNGDFNADLNLWQGLDADSFWDGTQNAAGPAGSGSVRVVYDIDPGRGATAPRQAGRSQCIHLPGPGVYRLNGWGRVSPGSDPPLVFNSARLLWELRYNGSAAGCEAGAADLNGIHPLATGAAWGQPANPALIDVPDSVWTSNTSLTIKLDVNGEVINPPTAWFDGITLDLEEGDVIFADDFEP